MNNEKPVFYATPGGLDIDDIPEVLASGGDWEDFLTDWLFNVADYYVESYTLDYVD